jgi:hypothetical protein
MVQLKKVVVILKEGMSLGTKIFPACVVHN